MTSRQLWLSMVFVLGACSSSPSESTPELAPESVVAQSETSTTSEAATASITGSAETTVASSVAPFEAYDDPLPTTADQGEVVSAYISRRSMSAREIELVWSAPEGAFEYQIHRLPFTSVQRPDVSVMTADNVFHIDDEETGVVTDSDVEEGTQYWYGVRGVDENGAVRSHGWHRADAVDDTEPPSPVGDLTLVFEDGEVLLTWTEPAENYELIEYRILRGVDGEEPTAVASTWNLEQTSFIDGDVPAEGIVVYAVVAYDFHYNVSDTAVVTLDRP